MSTDFEEAVIAFAQSLDARGRTPEEIRLKERRLLELIESEFDTSCFGIAMKRLVNGCAKIADLLEAERALPSGLRR